MPNLLLATRARSAKVHPASATPMPLTDGELDHVSGGTTSFITPGSVISSTIQLYPPSPIRGSGGT